MDYVQHPACAAWPEQSEADVAILAADIKQHGQRVPIVIDAETNTILDGWTRYRACKLARIGPVFETRTVDDPVAFTISMNQHRRHLDKSQLAAVAARLATLSVGRPSTKTAAEINWADLPNYSGEPKSGGKSVAVLAKTMGISPKQVTLAKEVMRKNPELAEDVAAGKVSINHAVQQVRDAEETSAPAGIVHDSNGDEVPDRITALYAASDQIGEWVKQLRRIQKEVNAAVRGREPWTAYVRREPIVAAISSAASDLALAELYSVCPVCAGDGDGCKHCCGRFDPEETPGSIGLVNKMTYDIVPDALKRGGKA